MKRLVCVLTLLVALAFLAACPQQVTIADVKADPGRYSGKEVSISGTVSSSFGALGQGAYEVDDGTGKIWVLTESGGVPGQGARVRVSGRVNSGITFAGRSFGTVLRESSREAESDH